MSTVETSENPFQAKDGRWYPTYLAMVAANKVANEDYLRSKGLLDAAAFLRKEKVKHVTKAPKTKNPKGSMQQLRRSSRRMALQAKRENAAVDRFFDEEEPPAVLSPTKAKRRLKISERVIKQETLSAEDLEKLQSLPDWLSDMEEWLTTVPHGNGYKVVSRDNAASVMRQVQKLVAGVGITYHHWPRGTSFKRGVKIHLGMKLNELYDEAVEMEATHGRDLGNGWLLRHPIRKLELYQQYRSSRSNEER